MTMLKKSTAALALVAAIVVPANTNATAMTAGAATASGVAAGMSAAAIASLIAGLVALGLIINEANDDGNS